METGKEIVPPIQPTVSGKFDIKRFYETLARILSERENVKIEVKVIEPEESAAREAAAS